MYKYIPEAADPKLHEFVLEAFEKRSQDVETRFGEYILNKYGFNIELPGFEYYYDPSLSAIGSAVGIAWGMIRKLIADSNQDLISVTGYTSCATPPIIVEDFKRSLALYLRDSGFSNIKYTNMYTGGEVNFVYDKLPTATVTNIDNEFKFKTHMKSILGSMIPTSPNDTTLEFVYPPEHYENIKVNENIEAAKLHYLKNAPNYKTLEEIPGFVTSGEGEDINTKVLNWFKESGFPNSLIIVPNQLILRE